jgi:hypothetical protein
MRKYLSSPVNGKEGLNLLSTNLNPEDELVRLGDPLCEVNL